MDRWHIQFVKLARLAVVPLIILLSCSLVSLYWFGLNLGKDFRGGLVIEARAEEKVSVVEMRKALDEAKLPQADVKLFGDDYTFMVTVSAVEEDNSQLVSDIKQVLGRELTNVEYRRTDLIGPEVSQDLAGKSFTAVALAILVMLFYIWMRFEWQFSLGAVLALMHDLILTLGFFAVFKLEFGIPSIAAILTIMGYSINDTVVVYDRIRDNLRLFKRQSLTSLIEKSVNETIKRTLITSLTTIFALLAMFFLGGEFLRSLCLPLLFGVVVGTFSSILIAAPMLLFTGVPREEL